MKWWKRMVEKIKNPEQNKTLMKWQERYQDAKSKYDEDITRMEERDGYYAGDRQVKGNPNSRDNAKKLAINIRNISYELIESQVDSSIPRPKVTPIHPEDIEQAKTIEAALNNWIKTLNINELNDMQERTTPIQGASFSLVEWDTTKGYHCSLGDLEITDIHPRQMIPQPGVTSIEKMDYFFIRTPQTKEYVKRRFGKSVEDEEESDKEIREGVSSDDIVTVITAYYKNKENGIGLYRWCGDVELESFEDYQARHLEVCKECGRPKQGDVCECGSKKFVKRKDEMTTVQLFNQEVTGIDPMTGSPIVEEVEVDVEIPYYKPNEFPLVMRKNISKDRSFLGFSDVQVIADQQDTIKKLGSKINEKLLKGGSYVTLPEDLGIETTDEELKIIRVENPNQKALIDVITVQADTSQDRVTLEENYQWAKSALGITDSFQGKYDASAISGTAKQYSINQAAGRLESKRIMKNNAFAKMYELMFKFALAYADDPIPITSQGMNGELEFTHFDKRVFLKQDSHGDWYWNDEFIFEVDPTSTLLTNREAMWNQADLKLQSGAFGQLGDLETNYLYWLEQERNGYPNAGEIKKNIEQRLAEQKEMMQMQAQQIGGVPDEMPVM
jgi:hypothetical protein